MPVIVVENAPLRPRFFYSNPRWKCFLRLRNKGGKTKGDDEKGRERKGSERERRELGRERGTLKGEETEVTEEEKMKGRKGKNNGGE